MHEHPQVDLVISNAPRGGWVVRDAGETVAAFSSIGELCAWLENEYRGLDNAEPPTPLPRIAREPAINGSQSGLLQQLGSHISGKR